jgi:hypothetical protein
MQTARRLARLTVAAALALGPAACGGGHDHAAPAPTPRTGPADVSGGTTTLQLDPTARQMLGLAGVTLTGIGGAQASEGRIELPIRGGTVSVAPLRGRIEHAGGVRLSAGARHVDATDLVLDPARNVVTARVANRRLPLLSLALSGPRVLPTGGAPLVLSGRASAAGGEIASALGSGLAANLLAKGLRLGTMRVAAQT